MNILLQIKGKEKELFAALPNLNDYEKAIIDTCGNKNCSQMAKESGISQYVLQKLLADFPDFDKYKEELFKIKSLSTSAIFWAADDTFSPRKYSEVLESNWLLRDGADNCYKKGISIVVLGIVINEYFFPIAFKNWVPKALAGDNYRSKVEILIELIEKFKDEMKNAIIIADGLYATRQMLKYLQDTGLLFVMRFASNRSIQPLDRNNETIGEKVAVSKCEQLKKERNMLAKGIKCLWHEYEVFITADFFINRRNEPDVKYIISNCNVTPKEHVKMYKCRWVIENFFKFCKQSLGFNDNRSHTLKNLLNHIAHVFSLYIKLQLHALKKRFFTIYQLLDLLRYKKSYFAFSDLALDHIFSLV